MATTLVAVKERTRQPASGLGKLTAGALAGVALVLIGLQIAMFGFEPVVSVLSAAFVIAAALIMVGWRWTPIVGAVLAAVMLALYGPILAGVLSEPAIQGPMFAAGLILIAFLAIGLVAGIAAGIQNYRRAPAERRMPAATLTLLAIVAGLVVGAIVVSAAPYPGTTASVDQATLETLPVLSTRNFAFEQSQIRVKAGQRVVLRLPNADGEAHFFDVDELNVHAPMPAHGAGLVIFEAPAAGGEYIFYCHPHADKATQQGMVGKLIVE